ncbi:MAG: C39 family peptidase [Patescibacteria group bacterium]
MKAIRLFVTLIILLIAFGAALYTQRVDVMEWYREVTTPVLPEAVGYEKAVEGVKAVEVVEGEEEVEEDVVLVIPSEATPGSEVEGSLVYEPTDPSASDSQSSSSGRDDTQINLAVPFTSQAPHANWDAPYKEMCEEASVYMVHRFYEGTPDGLMNADESDRDLLQILAFEMELFGFYEDTTAEQTATLTELMFGHTTELIENPSVDDIKAHLLLGHPVIVPAAGRELGNPYFTAPGPIYHMLVIRGFTEDDQFIVNDPGTYRGEAYLYDFDILMNAMHDWNNGGEITEGRKVVIVLTP